MQRRTLVLLMGIAALFGLLLAYFNHFDNPFELDDFHTIVNNQSIRKINIGEYFSDARTFSALPANQAYRPGVTTLNAIDYALWSKSPEEMPQPRWFHVSIFLFFILLCISLYFFYKKLFDLSFPKGEWNAYLALFAAALFGFHTANAETVNYIIARSDLYSTLFVILAFLVVMYFPRLKRFQVFLVPFILGYFIKEATLMFVPLLFLFVYLYEENASLRAADIFSSKFVRPLLVTLPGIIAGVYLYSLTVKMTPPTWSPAAPGIKWYDYLLTNFFVVVHYLNNFILPKNLSVDTDWTIITNHFDDRILAGCLVIAALLWLAVKCAYRRETKLVAFGILWFFITLIPTSTFFPFAEVLNDHRTFFGYIGLVLAVTGAVALPVYRWKAEGHTARWKVASLTAGGIMLLLAHALGVRERNKIWSSSGTLWKDATEKCPGSGRIWMNYGLTLMKRGDYNGAYNSFITAKEKWPFYPYIYINLGIVKNIMGKPAAAEPDFLTALQYGPGVPDAYKYYGDFLLQHGGISKADSICALGLERSPNNIELISLRTAIEKAKAGSAQQGAVTVPAMLEKIRANPTADNWINLSLAFYNEGDYRACIDAARQALKLNPSSDIAYNNICAAYNKIEEWDNAVIAGQKGLQINPNNQLLRSNLKVSLENQAKKGK